MNLRLNTKKKKCWKSFLSLNLKDVNYITYIFHIHFVHLLLWANQITYFVWLVCFFFSLSCSFEKSFFIHVQIHFMHAKCCTWNEHGKHKRHLKVKIEIKHQNHLFKFSKAAQESWMLMTNTWKGSTKLKWKRFLRMAAIAITSQNYINSMT